MNMSKEYGFDLLTWKNSLTDMAMLMDQEKPDCHCSNTFVPGRSLFFLRVTAGLCA